MKNSKIDKFGDKRWRNKKLQLHRLDGPAVERADGSKYWWINGSRLNLEEVKNWYKENELDPNNSLTTDQQILFKLKFG